MSGISARPQLTPTSQSNWWKKVKQLFLEGVCLQGGFECKYLCYTNARTQHILTINLFIWKHIFMMLMITPRTDIQKK